MTAPGQLTAEQAQALHQFHLVAEAIHAADADAVAAAVRAVPVPLRPLVGDVLERGWSDFFPPGRRGDDSRTRAAHQLACVGLAVRPGDAAAHLRFVPFWNAAVTEQHAVACADLLADRGRAWLGRLVTSLLRSPNRPARFSWHLVRRLVERGLIAAPDHPHHRADALHAYDWAELPERAAADPALAAALRELFRTPDVGHVLGRRLDPGTRTHRGLPADASWFSDAQWDGLLIAWGRDDAETRPGLIDDCLTAMSGALPDRDVPGFVTVHERLGLTLDELAERQDRYPALLLSSAPAAVVLARTQLRRLLEAGRLDGDGLLDVTPDVLLRREKTVVTEHLRLLTDALAAGPVAPGPTADAVVPALDPSRTDVAMKVARLLRRCADAMDDVRLLAAEVALAVPEPSPDLRRALGPLVPASAPAPAAPEPTPDAPLPADLPEPGRVEPVRDLAELRALLEEMHTVPTTAMDVERALDGLTRLRLEPADARAFVHGLHEHRPRGVPPLYDVLRAWAGWDTPQPQSHLVERGVTRDRDAVPDDAGVTEHRGTSTWAQPDGSPVTHEVVHWQWERTVASWTAPVLLGRRLGAVRLGQLALPPMPLLATPTREDGTVDAAALLARLEERARAGWTSEPHDVGTALLRLRPADRAALREAVLGEGGDERLAVVAAPLTWDRVAAALPSRYGEPSPVVGAWQQRGAPQGATDDPVRGWLDTPHVVRMWWHLPIRLDRWSDAGELDVALWALTLPSHPDVLAVHLARLLTEGVEGDGRHLPAPLAALGSSWSPLGAPALHALLVGGAARGAMARTAAAEALARACARGLVAAPDLACALAVLLDPAGPPLAHDGFTVEVRAKPNRVAGTLADASGIDDATGRVVLEALVDALALLAGLRGGVAFVELAARLAERFRARVTLPNPLATLAAGRSSSRTAQEARRLAAAGTP